MTTLMDDAIVSLRSVPREHQDELARLIIALTGGPAQPAYVYSAEEDAELDASETAAARGEFATDEEVRAVWAKHGL